jgi:hypothetical protein
VFLIKILDPTCNDLEGELFSEFHVEKPTALLSEPLNQNDSEKQITEK